MADAQYDEPWCRFPIQRVTRDLCVRLRQQRQEVIDTLLGQGAHERDALSGTARIFLIHLKGHLDEEIAMLEQLLWSEDTPHDQSQQSPDAPDTRAQHTRTPEDARSAEHPSAS